MTRHPHHPWLLPALLALALAPLSCGKSEGCLTGSQCDVEDCTCKEVACELYGTASTRDVRMTIFKSNSEASREYTVVISCATSTFLPLSGRKIEGAEFLDKCKIYRPGVGAKQWPKVTGHYCYFKEGGDAADQPMSVTCALDFENGYNAAADFSCTLKAVSAASP